VIGELRTMTTLLLAFALAQDGFQPLFTGSVAGWVKRGGAATYTVEGGELVGRTAPGTPNTFLCPPGVYGDFELEFEVKVHPSLNSGVQVRSHSVGGYRNGAVHGYQVEIDNASGKAGGIYDEQRRGWLDDLVKRPAAGKAFKSGQWNRYRVSAIGDRLQTWVNGVPAADLRDDLAIYGFIGFQVHSTDSKTPLEVRWRNIRIKDLGVPGAQPPAGGKWLLRTQADTANWVHEGTGRDCRWTWDGEGLTIASGNGDLSTRESFGDSLLHVEFMTDDNGGEGQANGNSGVYFHQSYEIQVLNSAPRGPLHNECGGIYSVKAPDFAMAFPAYQWQAYDLKFTAPRWEGDKKVSNAKINAYHNGVLIHREVEIPKGTTAGREEGAGNRPIRLQDHGNKIRYRNIWIKPL